MWCPPDIERGNAGAGLLAREYAEHTPLYRQSEIYGRQDVALSRSLLSGWVDAPRRKRRFRAVS